MEPTKPMRTDSISASEMRKDLANTLNRVAYEGERILIKRRDRRTVALVPIEDLEILFEVDASIDPAMSD